MSKLYGHTPGPWTYNPISTVRLEDGRTINDDTLVTEKSGWPVAQIVPRSKPGRFLANATLVAAAPTLLGACQKLILAEGKLAKSAKYGPPPVELLDEWATAYYLVEDAVKLATLPPKNEEPDTELTPPDNE